MIKIIISTIISLIKYIYYSFYCKIKKINNNDVWLISERGIDARDNGYHFYKYIKNNHKNINIKYVIDKKSIDSKKINENDIVDYKSKEHYILFKTSGLLISTHIMGYSPEARLFSRMDKKNILKINGKKIFLQHGITKDYIDYLTYKNTKLDLFISGAQPEYDFILKEFGYNNEVLKYTGFSRFDNLKNDEKNQILVMPTFRRWLTNKSNIINSDYFKTWNSLINNKDLIKYLEKNNMKLIFYPHLEMQKHIDYFKSTSKNILIASFDKYDVQKLLKESKLLITDYSSVFFDFAYMRKPIIYYQFDYSKYRTSHYKDGYFDYINNGFGPVVKKEEDVIKCLNNKSYNNYLSKVNDFFTYNDTNNSKRIYDEIKKL